MMDYKQVSVNVDNINFLLCNEVRRLEMEFRSDVNLGKAVCSLWVTYGDELLKICFVGVAEIKFPPLHARMQLGEFFVTDRLDHQLENIRYHAFDELTGLQVYSEDVAVYKLEE